MNARCGRSLRGSPLGFCPGLDSLCSRIPAGRLDSTGLPRRSARGDQATDRHSTSWRELKRTETVQPRGGGTASLCCYRSPESCLIEVKGIEGCIGWTWCSSYFFLRSSRPSSSATAGNDAATPGFTPHPPQPASLLAAAASVSVKRAVLHGIPGKAP